ncbi:glycosyltransferase family 1 protein [Helicobacter sp. L8]|uniref:glycosyltransferase family 4 protein n=1 Tax=Helicobacter sp. L8 TaxID=2316078 RepID=UPI001F094DF7|nr:glycosyltransferase family 1 protein [Helicobacter sp. L8]
MLDESTSILAHIEANILGIIHDVPFSPEWCLDAQTQASLKMPLETLIKRSCEIICFSACVKQDILNHAQYMGAKIHVIPHGLRNYSVLTPCSLPPALKEQGFILAVGAKGKRKNLKNLINAFKLLPTDLQARYKIALTGTEWNIDENFLEMVGESFVVDLGFVSDALLASLYKSARVLWYGSLAEGFGLPMLEAMEAGLVVLASHVSCMPEVLGDAGIYCDPYSVQDIATQLERALVDESLRAACIARGKKRVKQFDLKKSMQAHIEVIENLLENPSARG